MADERWARVKALFEAAVERPAVEREPFLFAETGDDVELRHEVESLLASDAAEASFLDRMPLAGADALANLPIARASIGAAPTSSLLTPGRRIGPYDVIELLGAGAMGEVYRSRDTTLNRDVAIKILPSSFAIDPGRLARFRREAQLLATLNHPNIGAIYGVEESTGAPALVLELVEGPTLADYIAGRPVTSDQALRIAGQIAEALEAAHERGIVHRDLKPSNIKVRPDGMVKVLDFGLGKALVTEPAMNAAVDQIEPSPRSAAATRDGLIVGTAAYMSPEQAKGQPADRRADIWAFGCVVYEMLAGRPVFQGDTLTDVLAAVVRDDPDWTALPSGMPASIYTLLRRCLTKNPRQRLQSIGDARIEIEAVEESVRTNGELTASHRSTRSRSPAPWLPWALLITLAASIGLLEALRPAPTQQNPLADAQFTRFTSFEGTEGGAEISPDGKFVAFLADKDGEFDIWLSQVGTGVFQNLTSEIAPLQPSGPTFRKFGFTADGSQIWFSPDTGPAMAQMIMPLIGGAPRPFLDRNATSPAWSPDGTRLAYFKNADGDPMFVADPSGADARQIFHGEHNHNPVWSSDGRWIYFARGAEPTDAMDVWRVGPSGESPEQLTTRGTAVNFIAPIDEHTILYVARGDDRSGPWLWALDVDRHTTRRISSGLGQYTSVSASRDGKRVVATVANPTASLWRVPVLDRVAEERDVQPVALPTGRALAARFSGASLFYLSTSGMGDGLWRARDGQASEIWKGTDGGLFDPPAVSPDGRRVAIIARREGKRHLLVVSTDGRSSRTLAPTLEIEGTIGQGMADWSPDGAWLVIGGRDAQGRGLFKVPVDGGNPVRLVTGRAWNPIWSPDGTLIVYAGKFFTGQVEVLGVRPDGAPVQLPSVRTRPGGYRFLPDGTALVYLPFIPSLDFWMFNLATHTKRQLTQLASQGTIGTFDVTPDGRAIVFDRTRENSDIVLIDLPK
jgi:serine/threonine protein kinase/Tol biopolymer transport system component